MENTLGNKKDEKKKEKEEKEKKEKKEKESKEKKEKKRRKRRRRRNVFVHCFERKSCDNMSNNNCCKLLPYLLVSLISSCPFTIRADDSFTAKEDGQINYTSTT